MFALFLALPVSATTELDNLARELDRTRAFCAVKTLQSSYAQYAQFGLWKRGGGRCSPRVAASSSTGWSRPDRR